MNQTAEEILRKPYSRLLVPDEDGGFFAQIVEFPGCVAEGESGPETLSALERAAVDWINAALSQGLTIPEPTGNQDASGRFALRMPRSIHARATMYAQREGVSLNQFLVAIIAERLGEEKTYSKLMGLNRAFAAIKSAFDQLVRADNRPKEITTTKGLSDNTVNYSSFISAGTRPLH